MVKVKDDSDERVDDVDNQLEGIGNVIDSHIDSITVLEQDKRDIVTKLEAIDATLGKINYEIKKFEEDKAATQIKMEKDIKICRFNNFGLCKNGENFYSFYHTEKLLKSIKTRVSVTECIC